MSFQAGLDNTRKEGKKQATQGRKRIIVIKKGSHEKHVSKEGNKDINKNNVQSPSSMKINIDKQVSVVEDSSSSSFGWKLPIFKWIWS